MWTKERQKEYSHIWYQKNKEKINTHQKEYDNTHKVKIKVKNHKFYQNHKEEIKNRQLKSHYGLSITEFDNLLLIQNNKCAICGQPLDLQIPRSVCIDHNHLTNKVRGILCSNCNKALGFFRDNPEYLRNAIKYLERD